MRPATATLTTLTTLAALGCYHAQPLDARALMTELRRADSIPAATPATPTSSRPPATGALTEAESVALALAWNPALRAFRAERGVAEGELTTAGELQNPVLRTEVTHLQRGSGQLGGDLRLSWTPPQPGVRSGRQGAARARVTEIDREIAEREWRLACDVRAAYADLLARDEEIRVAVDTIGNRRRLVTLVEQRTAKGAGTRFELDLARLSLVSAERDENDRRLARALAASALVALLGVGPPDGAVATAGVLPDDAGGVALPPPVALEDRAIAVRPALAAARARYEASEQTLRAETAARWPWISLTAIPRVRRNDLVGVPTDVAVGFELTLPVFNTNGGRVQSAAAARNQARADTVGVLAVLRADIAQALTTIASQRALLRRLNAQVTPLLADHERLLAQAAQAAELDLAAMVAAEDLVLETRTEVIATRLALRRAHLALERAVGDRIGD